MRLKCFLFLRRRGESLGTYARHLFEDAREIELIGEAAHLGYLIDLIVVDIAREQQFLRVVDARAIEELQGRDPLFLDELPSQIILAQGNVAVDLVYAERGIGKVVHDHVGHVFHMLRIARRAREGGEHVDQKLGERDHELGLLADIGVEIAIAHAHDRVKIAVRVVVDELWRLVRGYPARDGHMDIFEAALRLIGVVNARGNEHELMLRVVDDPAVFKGYRAVAARAIDEFPKVVLVPGYFVCAQIFSRIIDDRHEPPLFFCLHFSIISPNCPYFFANIIFLRNCGIRAPFVL